MRLPLITAAFAALSLSLPATAQNVRVFGGESQRACSTMLLFGENVMAGLTVTHGQPIWKDEYTSQLDKLKGKLNRLGKDLWTTFMTSVPVTIGGTEVPAGSYCVGLMCDAEGTFSLALIDATKAMKKSLMPFGPQEWKPDVTVPLTLNKDASEESVEKMTITLKASDKDPMKGTFTIAWGPHTLVAPMQVHAGGDK